MKDQWSFRDNSLDLLRLIAASQVMVLHTFEFTMKEVTNSLFFELLRIFPGVPIFFFVSGYLISKSYERSPDLSSYFKNRVLRIYPALILCVFINIVLIAWTGYFKEVQASFGDVSLLFLAKTSFLQFYNPEFMRAFGDGVLNGSLWTICVELQFYIVIPIFYRILKLKENQRIAALVLGLLGFVFLNRLLYLSAPEYSDSVLWKLYRVSFAPWFYMFLFGVIVQRNFEFFKSLLEDISVLYLVLPYVGVALLLNYFGIEFGNAIPPYIYFPLALIAFRFSYSFVGFSKKTLKGNDISYGIYIWHMVFVNQLLYLEDSISVYEVLMVLLATVVVSAASWFLIEKKALKLKNFTLREKIIHD